MMSSIFAFRIEGDTMSSLPILAAFFLHTIPAILKNLSINADVEGIFCRIAYKDFILVIFSPYFVQNSFDD